MTPVEALGKEKGIPGRFASAVRSWPDDVRALVPISFFYLAKTYSLHLILRRYKSDVHYREVLLEYLDRCHAKQVEEGLVEGDEEVLKKATVYPF